MGRSSSVGGRGGRSFPQKTRGSMKQASASIKTKQFHPLSSDNKMKCSYEDCEAHLIDTIQVSSMRCVDDMVQSIRDKKLINLVSEKPVMQVSTKTDPDEKAAEVNQYKIDYTTAQERYSYRDRYLKTNQSILKSTIMLKFVTKEMEDKIRDETDFNTTLDNPIELLIRIEGFMKKTDDGNYDFIHFWEGNKKFFNMKQGESEPLIHFKDRFMRQGELMKNQHGDSWFKEFAIKTQAYGKITDSNEKTIFTDNIYEAILSTGMLYNSDRARSKPLIDDLKSDYAKDIDNYPRTIEKTQNMLKLHMDAVKVHGANFHQGGGKNNKGNKNKKSEVRACYVCDDTAHVSPDCPHRLRPKSQWKHPKQFKDYAKKLNLSQVGGNGIGTTPAPTTAPTPVPIGSVPSAGSSITPGSVNTPLQLAGPSTGQILSIPTGMQYMQVPTQNGGSVMVPFVNSGQASVNDGQLVPGAGFSQFHRGFNATQVGFNSTQVQQATRKTGYYDLSGIFHQAIKGRNEHGVDVFVVPMPTGTSNTEVIGNWSCQGTTANEANQGLQFFENTRQQQGQREQDPFGLFHHLILDTAATNTTMCNSGMMHGIKKAVTDLDMHTNVGNRLVDKEGYLGKFPPPVYFDKWGIANVLAMCEMIAAGYRITMDTDIENAFVVHCDGGKQMRFVNRKGVYVFEQHGVNTESGFQQTSAMYRQQNDTNQPHFEIFDKSKGYVGVELDSKLKTVQHNKEGFTPKQVKAAMDARSAMHMLGAPSIKNLKYAIRSGLIKNCPITEEALQHAEAIYGPDSSTLKGKSTKPTPRKTFEDFIAIPPELLENNTEIVLCIDHMHINKSTFLTTIDETVKFRQCIPMENTTTDTVFKALDKILRKYNKANFRVVKIKCDRAFIPLTDEMLDRMGTVIDPTTAGDHEPTAERNNRTLKERIRVVVARLPYKAVPSMILELIASRAAELMNIFPAKGGISSHFSPQQIIERVNIDFKNDMVAEMGQYVHAIGTETNNTMAPRSIEAIYIGPTKGQRTGHQVFNLHTKRILSRPKVVVLPITDQVIQRVQTWAAEEGIHSLKFYDKKRNEETFQDGDQIAGVDDTQQGYLEEAFDQDYEPEQENEYDVNLQGRFDDIDDDEYDDLLEDQRDMDEDPDMPELTMRNRGDNNNNNDEDDANDSDDEQEDDVADLEHHQENVDRGTKNDIGSLVMDLEDLQEAPEEEVVFEPEEQAPSPLRKVTRSGMSYAQVVKKGINLSQVSKKQVLKKQVEKPSSRSGKGLNKKKVRGNRRRNRAATEAKHNLCFQQIGKEHMSDYQEQDAILIARCMMQIRDKFNTNEGLCFIQQYYINQGLKKFGEAGKAGVDKELKQMLMRNCFTPEFVKDMTESERKKAQVAMMLLAEKHTGEIKGRLVYRGDGTREWLSREDTASPTASQEAITTTCVVDAHEGRDMMSLDVPNAFIQTFMPEIKDGEERIYMKITGIMVQILIDMAPEYRDYVVLENGKRVIYVKVLRAIYGMLQSSLLWYNQFRSDLEQLGFVFNPYDPCVANKMVNEKQQTIRFHVDDLLSSHMDPKVNDEFAEWLNMRYGSIKKCTIVRGKIHRYLGMTLDFSRKGKLKIRMDDYVENMLSDFPVKFDENSKQETPAGNDLLEAGKGKILNEQYRQIFHTTVARGLFLSKRARLDIHPTITILASRVREPRESDWKKCVRMMRYLHNTMKWHTTLSAESLRVMKWSIDASFAVHPDFKSHTGGTMSWGKGAAQVMSRKQKLNSRSSTEAELIAVDDMITMILWTKLFMEWQGYPIEKNILYQDNKSAILLEENGRKSAGKRSRAINIRYFFVTDQVEKGNVKIEYCPTDDMIADFMTKPLQGEKFRKFRDLILGEQD